MAAAPTIFSTQGRVLMVVLQVVGNGATKSTKKPITRHFCLLDSLDLMVELGHRYARYWPIM